MSQERRSSERRGLVSQIRRHFDRDALRREEEFARDPILGYEQAARQEALAALMARQTYRTSLDAGCGNGRDFAMLLPHSGTLVGLDFSENMVAHAVARAASLGPRAGDILVVRADVTRLPFKSAIFDVVVCSEVLEHVVAWKQALREFHRVLRPGGEILVSTPNKLSLYGLTRYPGRFLLGSKHAYDKWRSYLELKKALTEGGFRVLDARGACYLPGDVSYYEPLRGWLSRCLGQLAIVEGRIQGWWPFKYLGYMIVVRSLRQ